jgi:protein-tyrosine phosphatase
MEKTALDLDWPTPQLAVGARYPAEAAAMLARELGIGRVVDLRAECCDDEEELRRHGMVLLKLPTEDRCAVPQQSLDDGVRWVRAQLSEGHKVFIHCQYGIGRSALLALCVMADAGVPPLDALSQLKSARRVVSPSPEQLGSYRCWLERHGLPVPGLQALFDIAYAHLREGRPGTGTLTG